jgi:hypothetical protein
MIGSQMAQAAFELQNRHEHEGFLPLGVPLGEASRRATEFAFKLILGSDAKSRFHQEDDGQFQKTSDQPALT